MTKNVKKINIFWDIDGTLAATSFSQNEFSSPAVRVGNSVGSGWSVRTRAMKILAWLNQPALKGLVTQHWISGWSYYANQINEHFGIEKWPVHLASGGTLSSKIVGVQEFMKKNPGERYIVYDDDLTEIPNPDGEDLVLRIPDWRTGVLDNEFHVLLSEVVEAAKELGLELKPLELDTKYFEDIFAPK